MKPWKEQQVSGLEIKNRIYNINNNTKKLSLLIAWKSECIKMKRLGNLEIDVKTFIVQWYCSKLNCTEFDK